ncbi:hypothetical protein Daura_22490 [Dactylosporangium aurantiacum]|uniref:Abortive infection protein n=2 Tax=Dactylosporangium aurantiacum TaxID=35754 RepID=A0A9Q9MGU8_9ACTN|nr:hypothetical protein [Dactylosporangium aurantiacum]MDG6107722.1 hypothetical protein [Dactylosporangium aurantiacum]UWZ58688.1 hypothetical protein Daura_22490 [Dactylosporangium aurantiacum]
MNYDVGAEMLAGRMSRPDFDEATVRGELAAIAGELHCDAVRISGQDHDRLRTATRIAHELGLTVYLSPLRGDLRQAQALDHVARGAELAEQLRAGGDTVLVIGLEATLFQHGFLPGETTADRIRVASRPVRMILGMLRTGDPHQRLNAYLGTAVALARERFGGLVTYASGSWERVDWTPFDIVGVNLYRDRKNHARYRDTLRAYAAHGKPLVITEFGCCTYRGAADRGGMGWAAVNRDTSPPRLADGIVRDERAQATELRELLDMYREEPVTGAFVFTWANYSYPWDEVAQRNLDTAGYGVVAVDRDGRWRPKEAYTMLASANV